MASVALSAERERRSENVFHMLLIEITVISICPERHEKTLYLLKINILNRITYCSYKSI